MRLLAYAADGLTNLYHAKLRSALALLGVLVGTASVVAMVLGGELATHEALSQFKTLGTDLLAISVSMISDSEDNKVSGKAEQLSLSESLSLSRVHSEIIQVAPYTQIFHPMFYQDQAVNGMMLGVTDTFQDIVHIKMQSGRFISLLDRYQFYCVVGHNIYKMLKQINIKEPMGETLQVGKQIFTIIGVIEPWPENAFVYANIDDSVLVPIMTSTIISKYASINNIIMRLKPNADIPKIEANVKTSISDMTGSTQINFRSAKELIARMKNQSDILTVFLGLIGSVSLLVGGIGVMNIMLVSVVERRREIGIRLAVGAKRRDIALLFLIEAIMLSLLGGGLGVLIGILVAYVIALFWHWEFTLFLLPPLVGFSVSVMIGIFFGFYPAYLASKLNPIDALRLD